MIISHFFTVATVSAPWRSLSSLWSSLRALQWAAAISALILTIGAILEYWEKLKQLTLLIGKWLLGRSKPFDRCILKKLLIHSLGPIMVTVGIAGDFIFEGRAFILEDRQEAQAEININSLEDRAATLKGQFDAVKQEADAVGDQEDSLNKRIDMASARMGTLEANILAQGPRAPLIEHSTRELVRRLSAFRGQNVNFLIWRENSSVYDRDALDTWGAIANILGEQGARWNIGHGGFTFLDTHLSAQGVIVFVNSRARKETMEAAKVLSDGLTKALPPSVNKMLAPVDPDFILPSITRGFLNKASPDALVAQDSTLIAVLIGENEHKIAKTRKK